MAGRAGPAAPAAAADDQQAVERWLRFALAQEGRGAPHPDPASLQTASTRSAHRLALRHLDGLPLFATDDCCFDVRLGVSLWDGAAGCFFGNTAHSAPVSYDMRRSKGKRGFHLNLDYNVYLLTRAALAGHDASHDSSAGSSTGTGAAGSGGAAPAAGATGSGLTAVVEVVLVERGEDGVTLNEFSAGWSMVPLSSGGASSSSGPLPQSAGPGIIAPGSPSKAALGIAASGGHRGGGGSRGKLHLGSCLGCGAAPSSPVLAHGPLSPLQSGALAARLGAGGSMSVPVFVGSPRWLLLHQASPPGKCPAPPQLLADGAECRLHFQFQPCPEAEAWAPLVPDNFLLSCRDVVPGVQRWSTQAGSSPRPSSAPAPTLAFLNIASQLEPPSLCTMHAVVLSGLRLHLPGGFVEVARQHAAAVWRQAHAGGGSTVGSSGAAASGRLLPLSDLQHRLRLRVSVHNGRRFVGPPAVCQAAALEPVQGRRGEHELLLAEPTPLAWLPADRHLLMVLELLLHTDPPPSSRGLGVPAGGSAGTGTAEIAEAPGVTVLGWTAVSPFTWQAGSLEPTVASGQHQATLRSGPGRWLRHMPVLDWRRLLERTNRLSPEAPTLTFSLAEAPGQAIWPPPVAPVPLQAALPAPQPPAHSIGRQAQLSTVPSEAETLVSVRPAPARQKAPALAPASFDLAALAGSKAVAVPTAVQAWHIAAHYDAAAAAGEQAQQAQQDLHSLPVLPSIRTRPLSATSPSSTDAAVLYAGSPTKARSSPARELGGWGSSSAGPRAPMSVPEAAAGAVPVDALPRRHISLAAELDDPLSSLEATLQFVAFEAEPDPIGGCSCGSGCHREAQQPLPPPLHFTYRSLAGPAVTAPLRLELAGGAGSPGGGGRQLFALVADECGPSGSSGDRSLTSVPVHPLPLLDVDVLLQLASAEGLPPAAAASLVRQHRLRAARWLAESWLQVDVWDSTSLLQVGTLSLPLHGLLRQGLPSTELLLRVPVADPNRAIARLDPSGSSAQLCCSPIQGSLIVRLACTGSQVDLQAVCGSQLQAGSCSGPALPLKQARQQGPGDATVVVRARPALEEGGQLALELARQEGVPEGIPPDRLAQELVGRAAAKVQRLLHYRSLPGAAHKQLTPGSTAATGVGSADGAGADAATAGASEAALLLERRLLSEVEAARERCRREAILARLQAELPFCQAVCIAPGETVGLECEFVNSSSSAGWFEVDLGTGSGSSKAATALSLVAGEAEWHALEPASKLAGLAHCADSCSPSSSLPRAVYSSRFQLAAHERCLLRLKLTCSLGEGQAAECGPDQGSQMRWHEVCIRPAGCSAVPLPTGATASAAATIRVGVQRLAAPAVHRALRLYCPASSTGQGCPAAVSHAVDLSQLPGGARLLELGQSAVFASSHPGARAALEGSRLLLSCAAAEGGGTQRFFVAAYSGGGNGSSKSGSSSTPVVGCPIEVWEVFAHSLPTLCLAASVGTAATASCFVAHEAAAGSSTGSQSQGLACSWRGCGAAELAASLGSGPSTAAPVGGRASRLVLSYEPRAVGRKELLLSVVAGSGSQLGEAAAQGGGKGGQWVAGRPQQLELLLVQLDSSSTRFTRTFEVEVPAGQSLSKKVRYSSPHSQARRFAVRSLQPGLLRPAQQWQRATGGVLLQPGEEVSIRLAFDGAAAAAAAAAAGHCGADGQACELLAVLESAAGAGSAGWQVEEVFRVLLRVV